MIERNAVSQEPSDALALLKADHRLVHDLFTQYASAGDVSTKQMIAEQVFTALERVFPAHFGERRTISEGYWNSYSLM